MTLLLIFPTHILFRARPATANLKHKTLRPSIVLERREGHVLGSYGAWKGRSSCLSSRNLIRSLHLHAQLLNSEH